MKTKNINIIFTILNVSLFFGVAALSIPQSGQMPQETVPVVRARLIELVDSNGKIRASLKTEESGETVFRLMDADQTIRVKLGASRDGSGLVMLNHATDPGIHALAKKDGTFLKLLDKEGKLQLIKP